MSEALIKRYADRWDCGGFSRNVGLPWSEALIERYTDRWNWGNLSWNARLPWDETLIDRYADRWDWEKLSNNEAIPWSHALYERFTPLNVGKVANHYNGGVRSLALEQVERLMRDFFMIQLPLIW